jgi:putative effector of murein hydrolase
MIAGLVIGFIVGAVVSCCVTMWMDEGAGIRPKILSSQIKQSVSLCVICGLLLLSGCAAVRVVKAMREFDTAKEKYENN